MSDLATLQARLEVLETRVAQFETVTTRRQLTTKQAMARLGYKSDDRFWQAVRRLGIPYERISPKVAIFYESDIDAVLARRLVGRRKAA